MGISAIQSVDVVIPCFEIGPRIHLTMDSVLCQARSADLLLRVFLIDDGSSAAGAVPAGTAAPAVTILRHACNRGRAAALNTGARAGAGELIWFLDADCSLASVSALPEHLETIAGHDVSVGMVQARQAGFWGAYQRRVAEARVARLQSGMDINACTSANLMVRRDVYVECGGFDERYTKYGFEDRDFFQRVQKRGKSVGVALESVAFHDANLDLEQVCRKMQTAGRYSSPIFRSDYPRDYRATVYGRFDVRERGWAFRAAIKVARAALHPGVRVVNRMLEFRVIPMGLRTLVARVYTAIAYAYGTLQAGNTVPK